MPGLLRLAAELFFSPVLLCDRDRDACLSLLLASDVWLQHELDQVHHDLKYADKWKLSTMSFEAHLLQRLTYVTTCMSLSTSTCSTHRVTLCTCASLRFALRRLKAKAKRLGRHCSALSSRGGRAATAEEEAEETESARRDNQFSQGWVIRVSGDWYLTPFVVQSLDHYACVANLRWALEAAFEHLVHSLMRACRHNRGVNMYSVSDRTSCLQLLVWPSAGALSLSH